jgi:GAF domain-containing protein
MTTTLDPPSPDHAPLTRAATHEFERLRARAVTRTELLGTGSEDRFDRLTRSAAERLDAPIAILTLVDGDRLYAKSIVGLRDRQMPRATTFCNVTIQSEAGFVVPDALQHPFFSTSPFVSGPPHIRSYAGQPLRGPGGWVVGSLCVMNTRPREFTHADRRALRSLADCAELEINRDLLGQVPQ